MNTRSGEVKTPTSMKLTDNFSKAEFECKCGNCTMPDSVLNNVKELARELQIVREYVGEPITINSSYRCPLHNKNVGGSIKSQHLLGRAADIVIDGFTPDEVYKIIINLESNPALGGVKFNGKGRYNSFTHLDIRSYPAKWDHRT